MCRLPDPSSSRDPSPSASLPPADSPVASGDRGAAPTAPVEPLETASVETAFDPARLLEEYQSSLVRLLLAVVEGLGRRPEVGVSSRTVTNFLKGNQQPPASVGNGSLLKLFGALARCPSGWIHEILGSLIESGEVQVAESGRADPSPGGVSEDPAPAAAGRQNRICLSRWGRELLRSTRSISIEVLPRPPCLGAHPELETELWDLRRRLAAEEDRAPFSIFPNSTLAALASARPRDLGELAGVPGFGEARIRKYGQAVLDVLRKECGEGVTGR